MQLKKSGVAARARGKDMGCFVAGTLVHTKDGLRPIEQIKEGDLVLSKPENGQGELSYQPVTRTFQYEDREVYFVSWQVLKDGFIDRFHEEDGYVVVTGAHPVWVEKIVDYPLTEARDGVLQRVVEMGDLMSIDSLYRQRWEHHWLHWGGGVRPIVVLADGRRAALQFMEPVLQSTEPDIGVGFVDAPEWEENHDGTKIQFGAAGPEIFGSWPIPRLQWLPDVDELNYDYTGYDTESELSVVKRSGGYLPIRRRVYNLEVANNHSYFVGELGLWVQAE